MLPGELFNSSTFIEYLLYAFTDNIKEYSADALKMCRSFDYRIHATWYPNAEEEETTADGIAIEMFIEKMIWVTAWHLVKRSREE